MGGRSWGLLCLAALACDDGSGTARDDEGCWTDGWAADKAVADATCEAAEACYGADESPADECIAAEDYQREAQEGSWCFDGCYVDSCLADIEAAADSCDFSGFEDSCYLAFFTPVPGEECERAW